MKIHEFKNLCLRANNGYIETMEEYFIYHKLLADNGDANAQYNIGFCYMNGVGVKQNPDTAHNYLLKALKQGHKMAEVFYDNIAC